VALVEGIKALALGFALSGLVAAAFQLLTARYPSFRQLQTGDLMALLAVPLLMVTAPFLIMRNSIRGRWLEGRPLFFVFIGSLIAFGWSLMVGRLLIDAALALAVAG
jgi:hypothetical protein